MQSPLRIKGRVGSGEMRVAVLCFVVVLFGVDLLVRPPYGLLSPHVLPIPLWHRPKSQGPVVCGWDYEASWSVGVSRGTSFLDLAPPGGAEPTFSCKHVTDVNVSFVADPFLLLPHQWPDTTPSTDVGASARPWFMFYEMKNLGNMLGEIGVAQSLDHGKTWRHLGTALAEPYHLSYPFVTYDPDTHRFVMIPETHKAQSVRIYATTVEAFPFGWRHVATTLEDAPYVDTAAVRVHDRWWIFTTHEYSLRVFSADTITGDWVEHPMSPVIRSDRRHGRSGGPPVVVDGVVYRVAQDCSEFYGAKIHVFRIDVLTDERYSETRMRTLTPLGSGSWAAHRMHHLAALPLPDGGWVAAWDGDAHPDDYEYFQHEGVWHYSKRIILVASVAALGYLVWCGTAATQILAWTIFLAGCIAVPLAALRTRVAILWHRKWLTLLAIILGLAFTISFHAAFVNIRPCCRDHLPGPPRPTRPSTVSGLASDFALVTAASAYYFDRLENFVGSAHYWEPGGNIIIYDMGLTAEQLAQVSCWKDVTLRRFDFSRYPPHVRNLFNYAFKPLLEDDVLQQVGSALILDAGLELRQPLTRIKRLMARDGFFIAQQSNFVGAKTHPATFAALGTRASDHAKQPFCAGGIQGYVRGREATARILPAAVKCALVEECIAPHGSGRENHNFDQSVASILVGKARLSCDASPDYAQGYMHLLTADETRRNRVVLGVRRWQLPGPYPRHIQRMETCPTSVLAPLDEGLIENYQAAHVGSDSPLHRCLVQHNNNRSACTEHISAHRARGTHSVSLSWDAWRVNVGTWLFKAALCPSFALVAVVVMVLGLLAIVMCAPVQRTRRPARP